jgi:hypothetical protein
MTAGLLARKGEAIPSSFFSMPPPRLVPAPMRDFSPEPQFPMAALTAVSAQTASQTHLDAPRPRHEAERPHKLRVALSDAEFEKLGLAAVKHNVSRHQLIREALDSYVEKLIATYRGDCRCIGGDGSCGAATTSCSAL